MELKTVGVLALIVLLGIAGGVVGYQGALERNARDAAKDSALERARADAEAAAKRAHVAQVDELKARLAVASCDKRAAEWERRAREKGE